MKNMKKLASLLLVMVMVLSLTAAAMAAEDTKHTITITNPNEGHTYKAYQVFVGTISEVDGEMMLTNIKWGNDVNSSALLSGLQNYTNGTPGYKSPYKDCKTADDVANILKDRYSDGPRVDIFAKIVNKNLVATGGSKSTFSDGKYVINVTGDGYYFVKDAADVPVSDAATKYMLQVAKDVEIKPKSGVPTMEKKVTDINDSTGDVSGWQDSADYDIGDSVPFQLKATIGKNFNAYTSYTLVFHDTQSDGLTFNPESVEVYVGNALVTDGYEVVFPAKDGHTFDIVFDDLRVYKDKVTADTVIKVEYTSTLNNNATIGAAGNPNSAHLEFSNNPYDAQKTGTTPEDVVIVFTYKTIINKVHKVNNENVPLTGAEFTLEKFVSRTEGDSWVPVTATEKSTDGATFTFSGLDDGRYRLHESKTPTGYNSIEDIYFTITATHEILSDRPELTALTATETESGSATDKTDGLVFTPNLPNASLSADVLNNAGTTLPTTGGIGTTLFYVIGSVLVLAAVVLLVTKKRMNAQN